MSTGTVTPPPAIPSQPPTVRMTAEEFGLKHSGDHVEYINGEVKEVPMAGSKHGAICARCVFTLGQFVYPNDLGHLFTNDTFVKVPTKDDPERVYDADVCYVPYTRLAKDANIPDGILPVTPELVVEVRSPTDRWTDAIAKMIDYIRAGVPVVIILDPKTRSASVFRDQDRQDVFEADKELTLPDVLPGFSVSVAALFA
jgi:Uma2 family endonuclease